MSALDTNSADGRLSGAGQRVAVVTGAGRGIGEQVARRLASRGYAVLATDVREETARETAEALGEPSWGMALDARDPEAHRAAVAAASERGRLEAWINNAGVLRTEKSWEHSDDDVRLMVETNVLGVIWGSRAAVEAMRQTGGGQIVNMASLSSFGAVPGLAVYGATKHAVLGFTESLQGDLEDSGIPIRVHAVCPDAVDTGMVREREQDSEAAIIFSAPRLLTPGEVADEVVALLDGNEIVRTVPRSRGALAKAFAPFPRASLAMTGFFKRQGEKKRRERAPASVDT